MRLVCLLALALAGTAQANGRPPATNGVAFHPADPSTILIRSTFGLLVSHDDGCSFHWVCEKAIGYGGEFDPKYAVAVDGTIFATTFEGLRVSRDGGCSWVTATDDNTKNLTGLWIDALDIGPDGTVWVATAESAGSNDVFSSSDNGITFLPRGQQSATIWWKSVKVAPSNKQRVYLTGYQVAKTSIAHLRRSDDNGATWTPLELFGSRRDPPDMKFGPTPIVLVAAVDPKAPDTLLLISIGANGSRGDRLYRSTDAGYSFTEVLATVDPIRDTVFAQDGTVYVATLNSTFKSTTNGLSFSPLTGSPQLACLGQRSDGKLFGCGANWEPDFKAVAVSPDNSATWSKQFRFVELAGPLACAATTTSGEQCDPAWPSLQAQFAATGPATCGVQHDTTLVDTTPEMPKDPSGCCDAGDAGVPLAAVGFSVGWLVLLRRRRKRCCG